MAQSNKDKLDNLMKEIANLVDLLVKVDEGSEPVDILTEQKQKVLDVLPVTPDDERKDGTYPMHKLLSCRPLTKTPEDGSDNGSDDGSDNGSDDGSEDISVEGYHNGTYPMHKLLSCRPLTKTEIPLDVLEKLIESGFNVNSRNCTYTRYALHMDTCLNLAIKNDHFDVVRWLVKHGADCDIDSRVHYHYDKQYGDNGYYHYTEEEYTSKTPIAELAYLQTPLDILAHKANAPLDLFHLLATPKSLNLPLKIAIDEGHYQNALHLIKLGFPIKCSAAGLMIHRYLRVYHMQYHDELFTRLIPSETIDILTCVDKVLTMSILTIIQEDNNTEQKEETEANDGEQESEANTMTSPPIKYQMLNRLFQYIIPTDQMCICFEKDCWERLEIKMNRVTFSQIYSSQTAYWWSLLLVNLGWHFKSTPQSVVPLHSVSASEEDVQLAHRIDDIWKTYRDTCSIISLQNMCIQQTRRSMRDFSDDSFMSLPVPIKLRKLLMYQHVAEIACEALEMYK